MMRKPHYFIWRAPDTPERTRRRSDKHCPNCNRFMFTCRYAPGFVYCPKCNKGEEALAEQVR